ncbi:MAG: hypothetical protein ACPGR7_09435 [Flavobacteriaceae bacterium]
MKNYIFSFLTLILFVSCDQLGFGESKKDKVVARVLEQRLYVSDLADYVPPGLSTQDSTVFAQGYINSWAKQQLMLHNSELNLSQEATRFGKLVDEYRASLYINAYKEGLVNQYLDTTITESEVYDYYIENQNNFRINKDLLQFDFVEIGQETLNKDELVSWFKSRDSLDLARLKSEELSLRKFEFNHDKWVTYEDFVNKVPVYKTIKKNDLLKKGLLFEKQDSISLYLLSVKNVKRRSDLAPLSYIKPTIRRIIIQQRKLDLIREIEQTLIDDAIKNKEFELY